MKKIDYRRVRRANPGAPDYAVTKAVAQFRKADHDWRKARRAAR